MLYLYISWHLSRVKKAGFETELGKVGKVVPVLN
jgi:hypothetical protein